LANSVAQLLEQQIVDRHIWCLHHVQGAKEGGGFRTALERQSDLPDADKVQEQHSQSAQQACGCSG